jgi:Putative prokaryotic signal transducing protein
VATDPIPNPNERLVKVFDAEQDSEVMVVRGLLEAEGIDCQVRAIDMPQDVMPLGGVMILVREADAPRALQVIEEYRRHPGEESDEDFTEGSQSES